METFSGVVIRITGTCPAKALGVSDVGTTIDVDIAEVAAGRDGIMVVADVPDGDGEAEDDSEADGEGIREKLLDGSGTDGDGETVEETDGELVQPAITTAEISSRDIRRLILDNNQKLCLAFRLSRK